MNDRRDQGIESYKPQPRRVEGRQVVGLAIRTTNQIEADFTKAQIPDLWSRFTRDGWATRLGELGAVGPVLAVYSKYESDASGAYQLLVGRAVNGPPSRVPDLTTEMVPPGQYLTFLCPGPIPQAVIEGWRRIWHFFEQPDAPARAYTADFEVYSDSQPVEIWIAIA
jgi:predicted transcriptional regulator YdeE